MVVERELRGLGISLHFDAYAGLPKVLADRVQIQQVLVNLLLNGAQAMSNVKGPRDLTIRLRDAGGEVRVDVQDRGRGISPGDDGAHLHGLPDHARRRNGDGAGHLPQLRRIP